MLEEQKVWSGWVWGWRVGLQRAVGECARQIAQGLVSHFTDFGFYTEVSEKYLEDLGS